ncbi:MAG: cupin domain-containing protein [Janthinobacterium lividum]
MNRREIITAISALALLNKDSFGEALIAPTVESRLTESKVYQFADLPTIPRLHGQVDQTVLSGTLATGEGLEVHETTLPPGQMPHPSHQHRHSELMLVRSGILEFDNDGHKVTAGPGGVFFVASNVPHAVKCVGTEAAEYYVIAIGRD